jgi:hypothetical protein
MEFSEQAREQQKRSLAVEVLRASGQLRLAARGYSMLPTLWPGDVLTIQAASLEQVSRGDLVLFAREGSFFIHRVLRSTREPMRLITRGDSMPGPDAPVTASELLGKVIAAERNGVSLSSVPVCSPLARGVGLALGSWGRLRSLVLRWRARKRAAGLGAASPDALSL